MVVEAMALPKRFNEALVKPTVLLVATLTSTGRLVLAIRAVPSKSVA